MNIIKSVIAVIITLLISPLVFIIHGALYVAIYDDEDMRPILVKHGGFWHCYIDGLKFMYLNFKG